MQPTSGLHVPVTMARDRNGRLTAVNENGPFKCLSCGNKMVYRQAHKRHRHGDVRGHFYHTAVTGCGESWAHVTAKIILKEHPQHPMQSHCGDCGSVQPFTVLPTGNRILDHAVAGHIVDVAILAVDDASLIGAIEVCPCDDDKRHELYTLVGNHWCEVSATDVVQSVIHQQPIPVKTHMCTVCHQRFLDGSTKTQTRLLQSEEQAAQLRECNEQLVAAQKARLLSVGGDHVSHDG